MKPWFGPAALIFLCSCNEPSLRDLVLGSSPREPLGPLGDYSCVGKGDVVVVLDNSTSIDRSEFGGLQTAAGEIVRRTRLNSVDGIAMGIVRFRGESAPVMALTDQESSLQEAIDELEQGAPDLDGGTDIVSGIDGGRDQFYTGKPRSGVPQVMVVITDGDDTRGNSDADIRRHSDAAGAEVFAVGVGRGMSVSTLRSIASQSDENHIFQVTDFDDLASRVDEVMRQACP